MNCVDVRTLLLDRSRGRLTEPTLSSVEEHLAGCPACRHEDAADRELSRLFAEHLPMRAAPRSLRGSIEARFATGSRPRASVRRTWVPWSAAAVVGALALGVWQQRSHSDAMLSEAVNDHLRILYTEHPLDVENGGIHQVKPWFAGRLDFAPEVAFGGDEEFALRGGASAYFLDRKAAAFVFQRRLHVITLLVFRADGLPWPVGLNGGTGPAHTAPMSSRGFHVLLWRANDLGYALVSDVDPSEIAALADRITGAERER